MPEPIADFFQNAEKELKKAEKRKPKTQNKVIILKKNKKYVVYAPINKRREIALILFGFFVGVLATFIFLYAKTKGII